MIKNKGQSYQLAVDEAGSGCVGYIERAREQPSWWPDHTSITTVLLVVTGSWRQSRLTALNSGCAL